MQLSSNELTIAQVSNNFDLSRSAVRKHLSILEEGNLITVTPRGKERLNQLNPDGLKMTSEWFNYFNQFWDTKLETLKNVIESSSTEHEK